MEAGETNMWFPFMRSKKTTVDPREVEIQAMKSKTINKLDRATVATRQLNAKIDKKGITELIFLATGGDLRSRR